jgi:cysteine-rich repeat protein
MPKEECDDGNILSYDGCSNTCKQEAGFNCVSGNSSSRTVCSEICGDGLKMGYLPCDDGNLADGDGCSSKCEIEIFWNCFGGTQTS